ncbi:MAG: hypothetical protein OXJ53_02835 [Gammaproteobacteria bacterium]|nr:hypothetical protein [Gammaproteobacteria bacterium]MDE0270092.1 hypothetical protein [Gammaproteobacteria bacterium]
MAATLLSPREAEARIGTMLEQAGDASFRLAVSESRAFQGKYLPLGEVRLGSGSDEPSELIRKGAFEWVLPSLDEVEEGLCRLLGTKPSNRNVGRALDHIAAAALRVGLIHPTFDADAVAEMPFQRSTTVVADTSGVLQGALDFVARFLHPAARVKVPAIVQVEIVNLADRFFSLRRKRSDKPAFRTSELMEHLKSQGGQRTLLRLELRSDTEVERTYLLGDPLRGAFQQDGNKDLRELNLSEPIRAYADRLILEAARQHQAQSGPDHVVRLLTADQGLTRMAMAEGIPALYFQAAEASLFFGQRLSGQTFHPFSGFIHRTPFSAVLWELATAFGAARIETKQSVLEVLAVGDDLPWAPYQTTDDLLWCRSGSKERDDDDVKEDSESSDAKRDRQTKRAQERTDENSPPAAPLRMLQFSTDKLLRLVCLLDDKQEMPESEVLAFLGLGRASSISGYRRFLEPSALARIDNGMWCATLGTQNLAAALRNERLDEVLGVLSEVPSFKAFAQSISDLSIGQPLDSSILKRGSSNYRILGEITRICVSLQGVGVLPTLSRLDAAAFANIALLRFTDMARGENYVAAGAWLEALIREDGIHPEVARELLDEASSQGLLNRYTEGSTPQVGRGDQKFHALRVRSGTPVVEEVHLHRGDYLIPGKGSVSLRIEKAAS